MDLDEELRILELQEDLLQFPSFDGDDAWRLGSILRVLAEGKAKPVAIAIWVAGQTLFYAATVTSDGRGVTPGNEDWLRRKRNTVLRFGKSSLRLGLELGRDGTTLEARQGLALADYATHGGGFPLLLRGTGCVGAVVVSGLAQREDHAIAVQAIGAQLGITVPQLGPG